MSNDLDLMEAALRSEQQPSDMGTDNLIPVKKVRRWKKVTVFNKTFWRYEIIIKRIL